MIGALALVMVLTLSSCAALDVVKTNSIASFGRMVEAAGAFASVDEQNGGFVINAPDGSARLFIASELGKAPEFDAVMVVDAKPFIDAGLDLAKLPAGMAEGKTLRVGARYGKGQSTRAQSAEAAFKAILDVSRYSTKYHADLGHFGLNLGGGNVFEWAKDLRTNDLDIVFVINPQVLVDAGVNPEKVAGWKYAMVTVMDDKGKTSKVYKFLKPFNLI